MSTARRPVLVAVGRAGEDDSALRYATEEALREGKAVRIVHVIPSAEPSYSRQEQQVLDAAEHVEKAGEGRVQVESVTGVGQVADVLVELSADADRLVLQHSRPPRFLRVRSGSVAPRVVARSTVPVVSVPSHWSGALTPGARVLVALQDRPSDDALLDRALETTRSLAGTLTVLHAGYAPGRYDAVLRSTAEREWTRRARREAVYRHVADWCTRYPDSDVHVLDVDLRPQQALVQASRDTDLILVGRAPSTDGTPHVGSLVRALIRESACPVEVFPT